MLWTFIAALLNALLGQLRQGVDDARDDQAHRDAGIASERAGQTSDAAAASQAMAEADAKTEASGGAEEALEQGTFLLTPSPSAPSALVSSANAAADRIPSKMAPMRAKRKVRRK